MAKAKRRGNNEGSITKRKDGRWMASITIGRDPATGKLKRSYFYAKTRQEAADQLSKALSDLSRGAFVAPHKLTLGQWLTTWLRDYVKPKVRPLTFDNYDMFIRRHLAPALGHIPLKDLRPDHVQHFYNEKRASGLSSGTINGLHIVLHAALKQAVRNQLAVRNASEATTRPIGSTRKMAPLTLEHVSQLLTAVKADRLYPAIFLELGSGLRRGELVGLRWQDANLDAGVVHVRQSLVRVATHGTSERKTRLVFQEPKTSYAQRTIPIPEDIIAELKAHKARQAQEKLMLGQAYQDMGLVFCHPDGTLLDPRSFTRHFKSLLKRSGVPAIRFHDARHTVATLLLELGESPKVVQTILGHSKISTTLDIYSHVSLDLERKAVAKLNAALRG
jgi:integrase